MAEPEKDRLADLLHAMSGGASPEDEPQDQPAPPPQDSPQPQPPPARSPAPVAKPLVGARIVRPPTPPPPPTIHRPATPLDEPPPEPQAPPVPAEAIPPAEPAPPEATDQSAPPEASAGNEPADEEIDSYQQDDLEAETYEESPDDAGVGEYEHAQTTGPAAAAQRRRLASAARAQSLLYMKRTMIPVMFTLGVICIALVLLGLTAGDKPFKVFRRLWFAIPAILVAVVMLGLGTFTIIQVRNELSRKAQRPG